LLPEKENQNQEKTNRIEFKFPLLILRTKLFSTVFDKFGSFRASRYISWMALFIVPFVAGIGLYFIANGLFGLLTNPVAGAVARELGPGAILLLPGINPIFPIVYGWIAIVCAIAIHECAHGVIARNVGLTVKSSGLLFILFVPFGAFVDVDEEQIKKAKPRASLKIMAAGVGANIFVAVVCLLSVLVIVGGLTPVIDGVYVNDITQGMPAQTAGILPKDVLVSIDNVRINNIMDLRTFLDCKTSGDIVQVTAARGEKWQDQSSISVNLTISENRTIMGVSVSDLMTENRLKNYQTFSLDRLPMYLIPPTLASGLPPFSDSLAPFYTHSIGSSWAIFANGFFWLWFVNFNIAIFNALPIYPLDGGRIFNITLKRFASKRMSEKAIYATTLATTIVCIGLFLLVTIVPFIG